MTSEAPELIADVSKFWRAFGGCDFDRGKSGTNAIVDARSKFVFSSVGPLGCACSRAFNTPYSTIGHAKGIF